MTLARILLAVVLTAVLLFIARTNSRGRPEFYTYSENGFSFEMTTIPKAYQSDTARIMLKITGPLGDSLMPVIRHAKFGQDATTPLSKYETTPLTPADSAEGRWEHLATGGLIGGRKWYYFEIRDNVGGRRAAFTPAPNQPFIMKYIGRTPDWIVFAHILLMFATVFFVVMGMLDGVDLVRGSPEVRPMAKMYFWAVVCAFLGGYPFGFAMNWYTFGTVWEGVPFGTDATDNKTQLLFVYLLLVMFASLGSLTRGKVGRDVYRARTLGVLGVLGFVLMLAIYLIPHSIQFAPLLTKVVCWSFIGVVATVYAVGLARTLIPKKTGKKQDRPQVEVAS